MAQAAGLTGLDREQQANAGLIVQIGKQLGMSSRDIAIAIMTAMDESSLHNLSGGDRDSGGLFQQRPSQGWGTRAQVTNPTYATTTFYNHLKQVGRRNSESPWAAAQAVQNSGFPDGSNYRQFWDRASNGFQVSAQEIAAHFMGMAPGAIDTSFTQTSGSGSKTGGMDVPNPDSIPSKLSADLKNKVISVLLNIFADKNIQFDKKYTQKQLEAMPDAQLSILYKQTVTGYKILGGILNAPMTFPGLDTIKKLDKGIDAVGDFFNSLAWIFNVDHFMKFLLYTFGVLAIGVGLGLVTFGGGSDEGGE